MSSSKQHFITTSALRLANDQLSPQSPRAILDKNSTTKKEGTRAYHMVRCWSYHLCKHQNSHQVGCWFSQGGILGLGTSYEDYAVIFFLFIAKEA